MTNHPEPKHRRLTYVDGISKAQHTPGACPVCFPVEYATFVAKHRADR